MPAFYHPSHQAAAVLAQMIFDDMQNPPMELVYENGDPMDDDEDEDEEEEEDVVHDHAAPQPINIPAPPPLNLLEDDIPALVVNLPEVGELNAVAQHIHVQGGHGNQHVAGWCISGKFVLGIWVWVGAIMVDCLIWAISKKVVSSSISWLIDWLIGWLARWMIDCSVDWLIV